MIFANFRTRKTVVIATAMAIPPRKSQGEVSCFESSHRPPRPKMRSGTTMRYPSSQDRFRACHRARRWASVLVFNGTGVSVIHSQKRGEYTRFRPNPQVRKLKMAKISHFSNPPAMFFHQTNEGSLRWTQFDHFNHWVALGSQRGA